jgi:hypothetical protein
MTTTEATSLTRLSEFRQQVVQLLDTIIKNNGEVNLIDGDTGIAGTRAPQVYNTHVQGGGEQVIQNFGSIITLGPNRVGSRGSGHGAIGSSPNSQGTSQIRMRVGPMRRANNVSDGSPVDPSYHGDGSTISISDVDDPDTNIGFCDGPLGNQTNMSSIVNFTDAYRIFATSGVQISTGLPAGTRGIANGMTTSLGGAIEKAPPIVLSAGNMDSAIPIEGLSGIIADEEVERIQGVARGKNTQDCIDELAGILDRTIGAIQRMALMQSALYANLGVQIPAGVNPHIPAACSFMIIENYQAFLNSLTQLRNDKVFWNKMYVTDGSPKKIASTNVFSS